jgi:ClpP class serine protease
MIINYPLPKSQLNKDIYMKIIKNIKLEIDEKEALRYQGYSKNKVVKPNELVLKIIQEEITRSYDLFKQKVSLTKSGMMNPRKSLS